MSATPSTMLPLGTTLPDFKLINVIDGQEFSSSSIPSSPALLVVFTANHCPYAIHAMPEIIRLVNEYLDKGLVAVAISSNDISTHPDDGPEQMRSLAIKDNYPFPYLYDESQNVAKAFTAACTPDIFLFNEDRKLVYRGQLDESRPKNDIPVTGKYLREALDQLLAGNEITIEQRPSLGCNIKWKPGNEPDYFG